MNCCPTQKSFAVLVNPKNPVNTEINTKNLEAPAALLGLQFHFLDASTSVTSSLRLQARPIASWWARYCR